MRSAVIIVAILAAPAFADSFADRMREANTLLGSGDYEGALAIYQDLKIDDPESERIAHNMGVAKFRYGNQLLESGNAQDALESLTEAGTHFESSMATGDDAIIDSAGFAAANTMLRSADAHVAMKAYQQAIESYEKAITNYEDVLRRDSSHAGAKQNRALARLRLKELMRDTPPEEQEQEQQQQQGQDENQQQDGGDSQEGEQDDQQQESGESSGENDEQSGQEQQAQDGGESESQEGDPGDPSQTPEEEQEFDLEDLKDADGEQQPPTPGDANEDDTEANRPTDMPSQQSIEALLQSLEQMDNRLQHDARRSPERSSRPRRWW